ncbi:O-antigen ligase family protein [Thermus caldilimi]|uniref:O-antigen ligase family protein n=1 Tax=Thermus caldilimi TaxID=2483360 RepID=UPI00107636D5|nr:O-antigen ligase family protein [Thermus caldilimi]
MYGVFVRWLFGVWVLLLLQADLKVTVHPYIHWWASIVILLLALPLLVRLPYALRHWIKIFAISWAGFLILSVFLSSLVSDELLYGLVQAIKLTTILMFAFPLFLGNEGLWRIGISVFPIAVMTNLLFIVLGLTLSPEFAGVMTGDGRWGTLLNYPGSLWRVGMLVIVWAMYEVWNGQKKLYWGLVLLGALALIYLDNSRTGAILAILAFLYTIFVLSLERKTPGTGLVFGVLIGVSLLTWSIASRELGVSGLLLQRAAESLNIALSRGFEDVDPTRYKMIQVALQRIKETGLLGGGIGTTRAETDEGPMVVHNTYLQVWADLGLMGFLSYVGLVVGWILWIPHFFIRVQAIPNISDRAVMYNALFLLLFYAISGLFHPLSTEWSEWITFILPYAAFATIFEKRGGRT